MFEDAAVTDFVTVATFVTRDEAAIAQGLLQAHGIMATVPEFHQFSAMPHLGFGEGFRVQVRAEDAERAKALLIEAQQETKD